MSIATVPREPLNERQRAEIKMFSLQLVADVRIIDLNLPPIGKETVHKTTESQHMKVHIKVQNFGPIEEAEIELRPLTVFVGESNTGKTYLAALIYALHKNFEGFSQFPWAYTSAFFLPPAYPSRIRYLQSHHPELAEEIFALLEKLNRPGPPFKFSDLPQQTRTLLESKLTDQEEFEDELKRCFDLESVSKLIRFTGGGGNEMKVSLRVCEGNQKLWNFEAQDTGVGTTVGGHISPDLVFRAADEAVLPETLDDGDLLKLLRASQGRAENSYYLPAARSGIMQSRGVITSSLIKRATRIGLERFPEVSTLSGMIADFLEQLIHYKERNTSSKTINSIAKALEDELLRGEIEVKLPAPEAYPEFLYRPQKVEEALRMSHSSAMVSELAPLVLFLRGIVQPGDVLIIEEPESHLHPVAQTKIAHTLARLVQAGVRVVITTHSHWLLQQIGNLIREGELRKQGESTRESADWLAKEQVGTWWFSVDKPVTEIPFDLIGGIEPLDYLDIAEDVYNRSAGLQNRLEETISAVEKPDFSSPVKI